MKQFYNLPAGRHGLAINKSFTLVEVLIFVTLITLIFITVSYIITFSLKNTKINEHKILATHYAEELKEWLRGEKEVDWNIFFNKSTPPTKTYCFNDQILSWPSIGSCGIVYSLAGLFKRELTLSGTGNQVTVSINIEWKEDNNTYTIPINTVFSLWE